MESQYSWIRASEVSWTFLVLGLRDYNGSKFTDLVIKIAEAATSTVTRSIFTTIAFAAEVIILVDVIFANFYLIRQCHFFSDYCCCPGAGSQHCHGLRRPFNRSYHTLKLTLSPVVSIEPPCKQALDPLWRLWPADQRIRGKRSWSFEKKLSNSGSYLSRTPSVCGWYWFYGAPSWYLRYQIRTL